MNANELADKLLKYSIPRLFELDELIHQSATMLRQQQACKQGCIRCDARKQLTDEEIAIIGDKCFGTMHYELWLRTNEFARAILRKASEK